MSQGRAWSGRCLLAVSLDTESCTTSVPLMPRRSKRLAGQPRSGKSKV